MSETAISQRPSDNQAGRYLSVALGDGVGWAFVPHSLPPRLEFGLPLVKALSAADRNLGELAGLAGNLPNPYLLIRPFMYKEAQQSSRIEGTQSEIEDLYYHESGQAVLPGMAPTTLPPGDTQEVLNYVSALEYGLKRLDTLPVSLRLIRELHEKLLRGVRGDSSDPGNFRRVQNWVGGGRFQDASYIPPPVPEMSPALEALEKYLHDQEDQLPPLVRLAMVHFQFEAIHPFKDGNGRIGRLLVILLMVHWGLLPLPLLYLSAYFERHRQEYYDRLLAVSQRGEWLAWIEFFLMAVAQQAQEAMKLSRKLLDLQATWRQNLIRAGVPAKVSALADSLFNQPILTVAQARDQLEVSYQTASRYLNRLVEAGILEPMDHIAYDRPYLATAIFTALKTA